MAVGQPDARLLLTAGLAPHRHPRHPRHPTPGTGDATPPRTTRATTTIQRVRRSEGVRSPGTTLERMAADLLAPVREVVGAPSASPAIRAFRVHVRDAAAADRAVAQLRASSHVATVERNGCAVMIAR